MSHASVSFICLTQGTHAAKHHPYGMGQRLSGMNRALNPLVKTIVYGAGAIKKPV